MNDMTVKGMFKYFYTPELLLAASTWIYTGINT